MNVETKIRLGGLIMLAGGIVTGCTDNVLTNTQANNGVPKIEQPTTDPTTVINDFKTATRILEKYLPPENITIINNAPALNTARVTIVAAEQRQKDVQQLADNLRGDRGWWELAAVVAGFLIWDTNKVAKSLARGAEAIATRMRRKVTAAS